METCSGAAIGKFGQELLTIIVRFAPILVSTLESYRFCTLIGYFISFLIKLLNESYETGPVPFLTQLVFSGGIAVLFASRSGEAGV